MHVLPAVRNSGLAALFAALVSSCAGDSPVPIEPDFAKASSGTVTVSSADPAAAPRDTTLDVRIRGSGFDASAAVQFLLDGAGDPRVHTNSTAFVSASEVVANITIDADAVADFRDVQVTLSSGKKGIGTEMFAVLPIQELAAPAGGSLAYGISAAGQVAGQVIGGCNGQALPAYWPSIEGPVTLLPLPAGFCGGRTFAISETGHITGFISTSDGFWSAARWVLNGTSHVVEYLGTPAAGGRYDAQGINSAGHVAAHQIGTGGYAAWRAAWWSPGTGWLEAPLAPGAEGCEGQGLSETDELVGACRINGISQAAYWASPTAAPVVLPRLPGYNNRHHATAINASGVIVGVVWNRSKSGSISEMGVRWYQAGGTWVVEALGSLGGGTSAAYGVNDAGQIVGWSRRGSGSNVAFLWTPGQGMRALEALTASDKGTAFSISNPGSLGVLVAGNSERAGTNRAVIWQP